MMTLTKPGCDEIDFVALYFLLFLVTVTPVSDDVLFFALYIPLYL